MIISKKYKYLFVELPRTGSTAISKELVEKYEGKSIYEKHTPYYVFFKNASQEERRYYVFSGVRHPIDRTVSLFFHLDKTLESIEIRLKRKNNILKKILLLYAKFYFKKRYDYAKKVNFNFSKYFLKYYKFPYVDWSILEHQKFNYVIKFEFLNDDFQKVLKELGIKSKGALPHINKTKGREKNFVQYFDKKAIARAKKIFAIYMERLGYKFPQEWGDYNITLIDKIKFHIKLTIMKIYWYLENL